MAPCVYKNDLLTVARYVSIFVLQVYMWKAGADG
jgi:hypothetical protein